MIRPASIPELQALNIDAEEYVGYRGDDSELMMKSLP
jgi:hypothetical protein